jgi:hypothetical protein
MKEIDKKDLYNVLGELFDFQEESEETIPQTELKGYTDKTQVCMIVPRTTGFKNFISGTFDLGEPLECKKILDDSMTGNATGTILPTDYIKYMLKLSKKYSQVKIYATKAKPVTFETKDFYYIVAPKMESD